MADAYLLLSVLLLGHIFGDFYFQPKSWVTCRNLHHFRSPKLYLHSLVHGVITLIIITLMTQNVALGLFSGAIVAFVHYVIDLIKSYLPPTVLPFLLDQLLHVITLYVLWFLISNKSIDIELERLISLTDYKVIAIAAAYIAIWKPASIVITMILSQWAPEDNTGSGGSNNNDSLRSAGDAIGKIERVLVLTFVFLNQFAGIGFLLAAKSVFRFGDLTRSQDKKLTEYVMLGTLASMTITILIGLIVGYIAGIFPTTK